MYLTNSALQPYFQPSRIKVLHDLPHSQVSLFIGRQNILNELSEYLERTQTQVLDAKA